MTPEEITELLAQEYLSQDSTRKREKRLWASDLGSEACKLGFFRKLRDFPQKPNTPGALMMFSQGENLEEQVAVNLARALEKNTPWRIVDQQTSVEYGGVTGKLDILMRNEETGDLLVLEVKSKRGNAFRFLNEPKPNNISQTRFYMAGTGATMGILVYVDREGQNFVRVFPVDRDDKAVDKDIAEAKLFLDDDNEPEPLSLQLDHRVNKGDDSFALKVPWQVTWCNDRECPCKKKIGHVPDGIIAKGKKDADGNIINIYPVNNGDTYLHVVTELAKQEGLIE